MPEKLQYAKVIGNGLQNGTISLTFSTALTKSAEIHYRQKLRLILKASVGLAKMGDLK